MTSNAFPIGAVRAQFPALARQQGDAATIYFDAPGGTQVCLPAITQATAYLEGGIANSGGAFATSVETDAMSDTARNGVATLLGGKPEEIAFGPNMTTLTFALARAVARTWKAGDEIVLTRLDHDANVAPWLEVAAERDVSVRWLDFDPADGMLRLDDLPGLLTERTRLVAFTAASNALGTLTPARAIIATVRQHSAALVFLDAVQSVPHVPTDVAALDCDFLVCSTYKLFGPHQGVLWAREAIVEGLTASKVRPAYNAGARRFETGAPSFEARAAVVGMIDYLDWLGGTVDPAATDQRGRLVAALAASQAYEEILCARLLDGLRGVPGVTIWGPLDAASRVPTVSFTMDGYTPRAVVERLAAAQINAWAGHFYAVEAVERLGLIDSGGLVRIGLCHYNEPREVDALIAVLATLAQEVGGAPVSATQPQPA